MVVEEAVRYIEVTFIAFLVNVAPAFVPPTWIVLSLYGINHPELNSLALSLFGVIGSVAGRFLVYLYSKPLKKYLPQKQADNINYFKRLLEGRRWSRFLGSFIYSLGPFPSNFLFVSSGISGIEILPVLAGFAVGRAVSYTSLVYASYKAFFLLEIFGLKRIRFLADLLGILAALSIVFINWKKLFKKVNKILKIDRNDLIP